jgi:DNA mismatch repair protein MutS2
MREISREGDALFSELREARAEVRRLRTALKGTQAPDLRQLEVGLDRASAVLTVGGSVHQELRQTKQKGQDEPLPLSQLKVGMSVGVVGFDAVGTLLELPKKNLVRVLVGVMKMSVPTSDLRLPLAGKKSQQKGLSLSARTQTPANWTHETSSSELLAPVRTDDIVLDLRGQRVEEGLSLTDQFIDELLRRQEPGGFVLHGHGTGAMKEAVRQHLRAHLCARSARAATRDEGGDAFTVFWLGTP